MKIKNRKTRETTIRNENYSQDEKVLLTKANLLLIIEIQGGRTAKALDLKYRQATAALKS